MPLLALAVVAAASSTGLPPVPGKSVRDISPVGPYSEPAVAIDERNPFHAVGAYQIGPSVAYTTDEGRSWHVESLWDKRYRVEGDVALTFARHRAYLSYIAFDQLGNDQYWAHGASRNAILVRRSPDGGKTWYPRAVEVIAHEGHPNLFEDKPIIVADDTNSKYAGNVYIGWTEFRLADAQILFARSTDGGASFSKPVRISTRNGTPRDDNVPSKASTRPSTPTEPSTPSGRTAHTSFSRRRPTGARVSHRPSRSSTSRPPTSRSAGSTHARPTGSRRSTSTVARRSSTFRGRIRATATRTSSSRRRATQARRGARRCA